MKPMFCTRIRIVLYEIRSVSYHRYPGTGLLEVREVTRVPVCISLFNKIINCFAFL
jgi:hypothetical protein